MDQDEIIKQVVHVFNKLSTNQQQPISKEMLLKFLDSQSNQEYDRGLFDQMYEKIVQKDSGQFTVQKFIRTLMEALKSLKNKISTIQTQISQKKKNLEDHKSTLHELQSQEQFNSNKISLDSRIRVTIHDADIQFPGNSPIAVILGCEDLRYSTKSARRENLVWEEKFEFDIQTGKEEIYIVILDKELADREEIGGQTKLNLQDFYDQKPHEITLELKDKYNLEYNGYILKYFDIYERQNIAKKSFKSYSKISKVQKMMQKNTRIIFICCSFLSKKTTKIHKETTRSLVITLQTNLLLRTNQNRVQKVNNG
ncbi:unnamed protein product (macronuclear) [Paramecium tetraurelia]|uniref:C2 domain-containing protein n=1 Tax=Paramecium tetraurelia TaxID=5888 RepID=A0ECK1_PARTE|nr:uncharacterized protein GSPATT00003887001 [Paramecium tetraurelia]CAK93018.1 unnamed protein product [Paramecium tetraurelia]|eukprot:XP_001460415.1 hypothetical protein (macronuclear) [Paramecium tetraurelia strain d4-2]